jgi:hypothetical protein
MSAFGSALVCWVRMGLWRGLRLGLAIALASLLWTGWAQPSWASLTDDRFDGNIFALYAGNGSLVPPKVPLDQALAKHEAAILLFYIDDSADCKRFASLYSQLQAGYGRAAEFIPISADTVLPGVEYGVTEAGHYYRGQVPQLVVFDSAGKVVLDEVGQTEFEVIDDRLRQMFDLLPREESNTLRRRQFNEVNAELIK